MQRVRNLITDILYVSRISGTKNKKALIFTSVFLSQLTALSDIAIIAIFAAILANQYTNISIVNNLIETLISSSYLILLVVFSRFIFQYFQKTIIYKIEHNVNKNLKIYLLKEIFDKRNYSVADSYFYINVLTTHISYFYTSFSNFLNSFLQIFVYAVYLFISDFRFVITFGIGILILLFPIKNLLKKSRLFMHQSYEKGQDSNKEVQRVVENLFLINILKKDTSEIKEFSNTLDSYVYNLFNNQKYALINSLIPSFFTLTILTIIISRNIFSNSISLDFIGVTLRLFQSFGNLTNSLNQIINSHVHIEKFYELEKNKITQNKKNFIVENNKDKITIKNLYFKYFNSDYIFENVNLEIQKNTHTIISGSNGSGKSTLLGLLAGFYYPTEGTVSTFTEKYGYVGATPLIFEATLLDNLTYGNNNPIDEVILLDYLKKLNVFKEQNNYDLNKIVSNKTLSSGQMQKIAFIRTIVSNPEIMLFDEATSNLDKESKKVVYEMLKNKKVTIINSTHEDIEFIDVDNIISIDIENESRKVKLK